MCALLSCVWKPRCSEEIAPTAPSKRPCSCGVGTSTVRSVLRCTDCKAPGSRKIGLCWLVKKMLISTAGWSSWRNS